MAAHQHSPGSDKAGGTYWVNNVEYQRYYCYEINCTVSMQVATGNTR